MTYIGSLSGSSSSGSSSTQNTGSISGLASGINTDAIVNALVQGAQAPLVSQLQQRQVLQWKQENYQQVNTALNSLQSSLSNLRLQSTFLAQQTSSSNSSLITATSNGLKVDLKLCGISVCSGGHTFFGKCVIYRPELWQYYVGSASRKPAWSEFYQHFRGAHRKWKGLYF